MFRAADPVMRLLDNAARIAAVLRLLPLFTALVPPLLRLLLLLPVLRLIVEVAAVRLRACDRHRSAEKQDSEAGEDLLFHGVSPSEIAAMPLLYCSM